MDPDVTRRTIRSVGELSARLKQLALAHLDDAAIVAVYDQYRFEHLGRRPNETKGQSFSAAGEILFRHVEILQGQVGGLERATWVQEFEGRCNQYRAALAPKWDTEWRELCDGKRLFRELQQFADLKMPLLAFKKRVVERMRAASSENWRAIDSHLKTLLKAG
jgi:hypothetical protein